METVGIREFRENLSGYLENSAPVAITKHGETVAFLLPAAPRMTEAEWAEFDRRTRRADEIMAEIGLSEEELVEDFQKWRASQKRK
jgi:prevent-host-death family protein